MAEMTPFLPFPLGKEKDEGEGEKGGGRSASASILSFSAPAQHCQPRIFTCIT